MRIAALSEFHFDETPEEQYVKEDKRNELLFPVYFPMRNRPSDGWTSCR